MENYRKASATTLWAWKTTARENFVREINNSIYQRPVTHKSTNHYQQKDSPSSANHQIIINNVIHQGTIINKLIN
jgi:hypothetical protein